MNHVFGLARHHSRLRAAGLLAGAVATVAGVSACQISLTPTASHESSRTGAGLDRSTPKTSLEYWLGQVAAGHFAAACIDMTQVIKGSKPPPPNTAKECASKSNPSVEGVKVVHANFTADKIKPGDPFKVRTVKSEQWLAEVKAQDIRVDNSTLLSVMFEHTKGVPRSQFHISFVLTRFHRDWYVSGVNFAF